MEAFWRHSPRMEIRVLDDFRVLCFLSLTQFTLGRGRLLPVHRFSICGSTFRFSHDFYLISLLNFFAYCLNYPKNTFPCYRLVPPQTSVKLFPLARPGLLPEHCLGSFRATHGV